MKIVGVSKIRRCDHIKLGRSNRLSRTIKQMSSKYQGTAL